MSNPKNIGTEQNDTKSVSIKQRQKAAGITGGKVLKAKADADALRLKPILKELEARGVTGRTAIAKALKQRKIPTVRGGQWTVTAVTNLIGRLAVIELGKIT